MTVKLRSGLVAGDRSGLELARRLVSEAGVAAIALHPRPAAVHHGGAPDYALVAELRELLEVPVIVSGGARTADGARRAYQRSNADAVMIARGSLGNPWIFAELTGRRTETPSRAEVESELLWMLDRAEQHWGPERGARNLRKLYPHYVERLGIAGAEADRFQRTESFDQVRELLSQTHVIASL